jgi:hypothetical protein
MLLIRASLFSCARGIALCAGMALPTACASAPSGVPALALQPLEQRGAGGGDLLYVSDTVSGDVYVLSYPQGVLQKTLIGFTDPGGECTDSKGDVFVTSTGGSDVVEYAHGASKPAATLKDAGYFPIGCSVDPLTGNLAVTNFSTTGSGQGDVVIYKHAKGRPTGDYTDSKIENMLLCSYDDKGNLFLDGLGQGSAFEFAELRGGGTSITNVALDQTITTAGGVVWDGTYVAVGDQSDNVIYRFAISGNKGTKVGSTTLGGAVEVFQFSIDGSRVIGPDAGAEDVGIWKYPKGGSALKTFTGFDAPIGTALSR